MHEVLVVGAGPAGSATAIHLARAGRAVLLIDRSDFPRRKACGEGIFPPGVAELGRLSVLENVARRSHTIRGVRFHLGSRSVEGHFGGALGVQRDLLDAAILARAREAGVEVRLGVTARSLISDSTGKPKGIETDEGVESARVIVAADGLNSRLRRQAGLDSGHRSGRYGITAHVEAEGDTDIITVHFRDGYELYVTPVGCGVLNVAVLGARQAIRALAAEGFDGFKRIVMRDQAIGGGVRLRHEPMVQGPFPARSLRAYRGRLVLAGDAAGFFDGITGEGVSLALQSARDCAQAINCALSTGTTRPFGLYERQLRRRARNSTMLGRLTLFLAQHPTLAGIAMRNLARRPETFERLLAINYGGAGFRDLRAADIGTLLRPV